MQERLRYAPLGWSKRYEFNESDLRCACDTLDVWVDSVSMGRTNLPPEKVPWDAIQTLMAQCIYGGKIDNDFDQVRTNHNSSFNAEHTRAREVLLQRLMTSFVAKMFNKKTFDSDFSLVQQDTKKILMPDGIR